jgi:integrase
MDLALLTGQRQGDLLRLKWKQITPEGITFRQGKTGKRLRVTMSPALQAVLESRQAVRPRPATGVRPASP